MNEPLPRLLTEQPIGFTAAEFLRMGEAGVFEDMKVELIEGEIQRKNPPMGGHSSKQAILIGQLWTAIPDAAGRLHGEAGIDLGSATVVGCDVVLLRESMIDRRLLQPEEVLLAIEIAETTIDRDLGVNRPLYAAAGIPDYWVVDGACQVTHVFAGPAGDTYCSVAQIPFGRPSPVPGTSATVTL